MATCFRFYIILVEPLLLFLDVKVNIPDFYLILWESLGISILKIHRSLIWYEVSILLRKKHLILCVFNVYLSSSKKFLVDCTKSTYVWWFKLKVLCFWKDKKKNSYGQTVWEILNKKIFLQWLLYINIDTEFSKWVVNQTTPQILGNFAFCVCFQNSY